MNQGLRVKDITDFIESYAPVFLAEAWDNVGLMTGSYKAEVGGVLFCMDITDDIIDEAIEYNCQMIVTHHPFIFKPMKNIHDNNLKGSLTMKLIKNSINVYSAHTNLDYARKGVNHCLAEALELKDTDVVKPHPSGYRDEDERPLGLGRVGTLPCDMEITDFCRFVKNKLEIDTLRLAGKGKSSIVRRAAVMSGAFDNSDIASVLTSGADVLVTGDLRYHDIVENMGTGLYIIDAGHFSTERIVLQSLKDKLAREFKDILFFVSKEEKDPFIYI